LARKVSIVLKSASHATSTAPTLTVNLIAERVAELLARARQPARPVNDTIANALARLGKAAIPALIDVATDTNPRVRAIAAQALGRIRDQRALDILIAALADPDMNVRDVGVYWLGPLHDRRATEPLLAALATSDTRQRSMIVRSLGQLRDQRAIEPLLSMLNDEQEDLFVREEAARSLGALKAKGALDSLARLFRQQGDHFRYAILQALLSLGKTALPLILDLAEDTDPDVRRMIALTLGGMRRQPVIEPLTRLLNDPDDSVRANAAYALGQLRHPMSDKLLLTALSDPHPDVRYSAVSALAMVGEPSALPALEALQRDDGVNRTGSKISDEAARAITIIGLRT
jgi:HEAT repeat protein